MTPVADGAICFRSTVGVTDVRSALMESFTSKCSSKPSGELAASVSGKGAVLTVRVALVSAGVSLHTVFTAHTVVPTVMGAPVLLKTAILGLANVTVALLYVPAATFKF